MEHGSKNGEHKILEACDLPLTGKGVVHMIVTDLAVLDVTPEGLVLIETAPGVTVEEIKAKTGAPIIVSPALKELVLA
ncbi:Succinyl-CoA:3-ketoacid coenzyme A transferase subunit B [compost metagenome]